MIAKHIQYKANKGSYQRLAEYISDGHMILNSMENFEENPKGEKLLASWAAGCMCDDDYELFIKEVEATQALNSRSTKEKTYHLIVSFKPEDEEKLNATTFKEIELMIAKELGFQENQRFCGVHKNTANTHMHIAYNMIHPTKFIRIEPYRDYLKLQKICREIEKKYQLAPEISSEKNADGTKLTPKAKDLEVRTSQKSFTRYLNEKKQYIFEALEKANTWKEFQNHLAKIDVTAKQRGNGLVFKNLDQKYSVKASDVDRHLSFSKIEKKLGKYEDITIPDSTEIEKIDTYKAEPINAPHKNDTLYNEYLEGLEERRKELATLKENEKVLYNSIKLKWKNQRMQAELISMNFAHKAQLLATIKNLEEAELLKNRKEFLSYTKNVRDEIPFTNWTTFLQYKATNGDETALEILRSTRKGITEKDNINVSEDKGLEIKAEAIEKRAQISQLNVNSSSRKSLISVTKMEESYNLIYNITEKMQTEKPFTYNIDLKGTIIYHLKNNLGTIKDTGKEIFFSKNDVCKQIAMKYATLKFGKVTILNNKIFRQNNQSTSQTMLR